MTTRQPAMLTPEAIEAAMRHRLFSDGTCPACHPHGTVEEGPAGATWTVPCKHGGVRQGVERAIRPFIAAQDRDALADVVWEAIDDALPVGADMRGMVEASRAVVAALLGPPPEA